MGSLLKRPNGRFAVRFLDREKNKRVVSLGESTKQQAKNHRLHIEALVAAVESGDWRKAPDDTLAWTESVGHSIRQRLIDVGLIPPAANEVTSTSGVVEVDHPAPVTIGEWTQRFIDSRKGTVEPGTIEAMEYGRRSLIRHFTESKPMADITEGDADEFKVYLIREGLSAATVGRRIKHAKQFFRAACRKKLITDNPFEDHRGGDQSNDDRKVYIPEETIDRLIASEPSQEWKLIWALARYGGCRIPSEAWAMKWEHIDWERNRLTIMSQKTKRYKGKAKRVIPLWPKLATQLLAMRDIAPVGAPYVFPSDWRTRANPRTQAARNIRKNGLEPWDKPFTNCRASRETDLNRTNPHHVVCAWIGHSSDVSKQHYLQITDEHFTTALESDSKNVTQNVTICEGFNGTGGNDRESGKAEKPLAAINNAGDRTSALVYAGPQGMEHPPKTRGFSIQAPTVTPNVTTFGGNDRERLVGLAVAAIHRMSNAGITRFLEGLRR